MSHVNDWVLVFRVVRVTLYSGVSLGRSSAWLPFLLELITWKTSQIHYFFFILFTLHKGHTFFSEHPPLLMKNYEKCSKIFLSSKYVKIYTTTPWNCSAWRTVWAHQWLNTEAIHIDHILDKLPELSCRKSPSQTLGSALDIWLRAGFPPVRCWSCSRACFSGGPNE